MSPRVRVIVVVAAAAAAAAGVAVGATLLTDDRPAAARDSLVLRKGAPPLVLDLGVRDDPEARALRRADRLYAAGRRGQAAAVFARYGSLEARVGAALAAWPTGSLGRLEELARSHPRSGLVQLHLGLAHLWRGEAQRALAAWRAALARDPDSPYAIRAESLVYPDFPPGLPPFVPSFGEPAGLARLPARRELDALARAARRRDVRAKLLYGVRLQRLGHRVSAERQFAAAAALAPGDPEALVAAAVGRFEKGRPARAFSRLGPLAARYPRSTTVRFHLGLLLLWLDRVPAARRELRLARASGPQTPLGKEANTFLVRLGSIGTN